MRICLDQNEQKTPAVLTNGLNPIWNHLMHFSICIPELCLIRFTVKDSDKSNTGLGQYSIPFLSMQSGK
jgi:Ca2+-dependent lipid-binding protein